MKVYVVNAQNHNYTKAEKFGELVTVSEGNLPIFKTDLMLEILNEKLKDMDSEDFLLVSGHALVNIMATTLIFRRLPAIKLLVFDAKEQNYVVRHLTKY